MFCENPIRLVYVKIPDLWDDSDAGGYLDCYNDLAYHMSGKFAVVMLTDHECIRFDRNGVCKTAITEEVLTQLREEYNPCIEKQVGKAPWIYYEHTLFCGEPIKSVDISEDKREIRVSFDDFDFRFVSHESEDEYPSRVRDWGSYYLTRGCERHLKRSCRACGGAWEILSDYAGDYLVRCRSCKKATRATFFVQQAIDEWHAGYLSRVVEDEKIANVNP